MYGLDVDETRSAEPATNDGWTALAFQARAAYDSAARAWMVSTPKIIYALLENNR